VKSTRLEAFSDGVIAILITIMVLELHTPAGSDLHSLTSLWPTFLAYVLSFVNVGIYWNNHHHMLQATERVNGRVLWANLHLLFWISLFPFTTAWMGGESEQSQHFEQVPVTTYGIVLLLAAVAYFILQRAIIDENGVDSTLAKALGNDTKGKASPVIYTVAIAASFFDRWIALGLYIVVALIWFIPDRRVETEIAHADATHED
jgi:uncharacterized membrane protein